MAILSLITKIVAGLFTSSEQDEARDTIAYHGQGDERELRFSRASVLRRYY